MKLVLLPVGKCHERVNTPQWQPHAEYIGTILISVDFRRCWKVTNMVCV